MTDCLPDGQSDLPSTPSHTSLIRPIPRCHSQASTSLPIPPSIYHLPFTRVSLALYPTEAAPPPIQKAASQKVESIHPSRRSQISRPSPPQPFLFLARAHSRLAYLITDANNINSISAVPSTSLFLCVEKFVRASSKTEESHRPPTYPKLRPAHAVEDHAVHCSRPRLPSLPGMLYYSSFLGGLPFHSIPSCFSHSPSFVIRIPSYTRLTHHPFSRT